jgi:uncharacterized membrane protein
MICKNCGQENPPQARFCLKCGAALVKTFAPGVESSYVNGWHQLWPHFLELFLIIIIYAVISGVGGLISSFLFFLQPFFSVLVGYPLGYGVSYAYLRAARDEKMQINDMFAGFNNYWNAVGAGLLVTIIIVVGFIFLIVPGIYLACKLAFVPYLVVDRKMGVMKAIEESWRMTNGYGWKVFLIYLLAIPIYIAGLICLLVGVIISAMWVSMAMASLYHAVSASDVAPKPLAPTAPPRTIT